MVLGMRAEHRAAVARRKQNVEQLFVVDLQPIIGHEDLDRTMALLDQRRQIALQRFLGRIGDDHVERVVDHRALSRERVILLEHLRQLHADVLGRERDHGGGAAEGGRDGRALERIGVHDACGRELLDMGMAVDTAGQHQLAPRVDLPPCARQPAADGCDRLAGNGDVGLEHVAHGRDASAADDEGRRRARSWQTPRVLSPEILSLAFAG